jgi:hypothetical protein
MCEPPNKDSTARFAANLVSFQKSILDVNNLSSTFTSLREFRGGFSAESRKPF